MKQLLKGKALEEFENWYFFKFQPDSRKPITWFWTLPTSMQWGVLVDFFDSVGIHLAIGYYHQGYIHSLTKDKPYYWATRQEAREAAIEKAVELLNERKEG